MQANIFVFAFLLLSVAVAAYGYQPECLEPSLYGCRGDEDATFGWTFDREDGGCRQGSYCTRFGQPKNYFRSEGDCKKACGGA
uniref:Savignygrin (-) n=1 Tax=Ornithodoros kalahariensis TaxID=1580572 RepID=KUNPM_ORNKA|nr:RecName: Full=Savignygrin (-); AltName: Full=Platelet aggregation inhibitor; Short=PAI; Flags: Precursor [Ornithodoros kalahariensis]AAM54048.1 savignygrin [Ornithodoros kalahariensis]